MRHTIALIALVSFSMAQWIETTIPLPDSLPGLSGLTVMHYHSANHTLYVGGNAGLIAVDAATHQKTAGCDLPGTPYFICGSETSSKLYCASSYQRTVVWVVDCATNSLRTTVTVDSFLGDMCYAAAENKVYVACPKAGVVDVIDCSTDTVVARIGSLAGASAVCYNPALNRVYLTESASDEVAVIDCAADTVVRRIGVRGVEPSDICFDSVTNCVYTANSQSRTVSVIDCAGDSVARVILVGRDPGNLLVGSHGKVYCSVDDSTLTVIHDGETRAISMGQDPYWPELGYDPANDKVYWSGGDYYSDIVVVDGDGDSVTSRIGPGTVGAGPRTLCYDPVGNGTFAASKAGARANFIDGATNQVTGMVWLGVVRPGVLRYNPLNNHVYCLEEGWNRAENCLMVIDGDSNRVLKLLPAGGSCDSMLWNPVNNKLYISNSGDNTVSIVDCTSDSMVATISTQGGWPNASCCSDDGKVYVCNAGYGVTVIDPVGDSVCKVIEVGGSPWGICYDQTDNKVYIGMWDDGDSVKVISVDSDSVVATVAMPSGLHYQLVTWNRNHDKVYVTSSDDGKVVVIDCAADTVLRTIVTTSSGFRLAYGDSINDRVYLADADGTTLRILDAKTDSMYKSLNAGSVGAMADNGLPGANHRLYSTGHYLSTEVAVVGGEADSVLRRITVAEEPFALAWNPVRSWMYVSNASSSSVTVLRDTLPVGIKESFRSRMASARPAPTVVRGVLFLEEATSRKPRAASLMDVSGRKVLDLRPGANDVRALAPGVYFVRQQDSRGQGFDDSRVAKVIVTR